MRRMIRKPSFEESQYAHPIALGGTDSMTIEQASKKFNFVRQSKVGQPNGYAKLTSNALLPVELLPVDSVSQNKISVGLSQEALAGRTNKYKITNFDSFTNYAISCTVGEVTLVGDDITYRLPVGATSGGFTINGEYFALAVTTPAVKVPSITTPPDGTTGIGHTYTVIASDFAVSAGTDVHVSSSWQLSASPAFGAIVKSSLDDTSNKTRWDISQLDYGVDYYVRVRYTGATNGTSEWSQAAKFTTLEPIILAKPTFTNLTNGQLLDYPFTSRVYVQTSPFATLSGVDEIDYSALILFDKELVPLASTVNYDGSTTFDITDLISFEGDSNYFLKVEYCGKTGLKIETDELRVKTADDKFYPVFTIDESTEPLVSCVDFFHYQLTNLPPNYNFTAEFKDKVTDLVEVFSHTSDAQGRFDKTVYFSHFDMSGVNDVTVKLPSYHSKPVGSTVIDRDIVALAPIVMFDKFGYKSNQTLRWYLAGGYPNTTVNVQVKLNDTVKEDLVTQLDASGKSPVELFPLSDSYVGTLSFTADFPGVSGPRHINKKVTTVEMFYYTPEFIVPDHDVIFGDEFELRIVGGKPNVAVKGKLATNGVFAPGEFTVSLNSLGAVTSKFTEAEYGSIGTYTISLDFGLHGGVITRDIKIVERVYHPVVTMPGLPIIFGDPIPTSITGGKPFQVVGVKSKFFGELHPNGLNVNDVNITLNSSGSYSITFGPEHYTAYGRWELECNFGVYGGIVTKSVIIKDGRYFPVVIVSSSKIRYGDDVTFTLSGGKPNALCHWKAILTNAQHPNGLVVNDMHFRLDVHGENITVFKKESYGAAGTWVCEIDFLGNGENQTRTVEIVDGVYFPVLEVASGLVRFGDSFSVGIKHGFPNSTVPTKITLEGTLIQAIDMPLDGSGNYTVNVTKENYQSPGNWKIECDFGTNGGIKSQNISIKEGIYSPVVTGPADPVSYGNEFTVNITGGNPSTKFKSVSKLNDVFISSVMLTLDEFGAFTTVIKEANYNAPGRWTLEVDFFENGGVKIIAINIVSEFNPVLRVPEAPVLFGNNVPVSISGGRPGATVTGESSLNGNFISRSPFTLDNQGNYAVDFVKANYGSPGTWAISVDFGVDGGVLSKNVVIVSEYKPVVTVPLTVVKFGDPFTVTIISGRANSAVRAKTWHNTTIINDVDVVLDASGAWSITLTELHYLVAGTWEIELDFGADGGKIKKVVTISHESSLRVYRPTVTAPTITVPFGNSFDTVINGGKPGAVVAFKTKLTNTSKPNGKIISEGSLALDLNGSWNATFVEANYGEGGTWAIWLDFGDNGGQMLFNVEIAEKATTPGGGGGGGTTTYTPVLTTPESITFGEGIPWSVTGGKPGGSYKTTNFLYNVQAGTGTFTLDTTTGGAGGTVTQAVYNAPGTWRTEFDFGVDGGIVTKTVIINPAGTGGGGGTGGTPSVTMATTGILTASVDATLTNGTANSTIPIVVTGPSGGSFNDSVTLGATGGAVKTFQPTQISIQGTYTFEFDFGTNGGKITKMVTMDVPATGGGGGTGGTPTVEVVQPASDPVITVPATATANSSFPWSVTNALPPNDATIRITVRNAAYNIVKTYSFNVVFDAAGSASGTITTDPATENMTYVFYIDFNRVPNLARTLTVAVTP